MRINNRFYIYNRREDKAIITNLLNEKNETVTLPGDMNYATMKKVMEICRKRTISVADKNNALTRALRIAGISDDEITVRLFSAAVTTVDDSGNTVKVYDKNIAKDAITKLIQFFTEFNFSPSFRFINSFAISPNPKEYVYNYFAVQDHPYTNDISEKIKSKEFTNIVALFKTCGCTPKPINTRFELYFGEPGTGKTTKAMTLANKCIVCSSDMLPADLMQNFCFKDGKADFDPSDLWKAMENGESIVLDEVNMLPFESLRFLQGITDGKDTFDYKGHTITIHPDFKIYATMNLNVNGQCIPLPAPLVDRSYDIKEFKLTASQLLAALN